MGKGTRKTQLMQRGMCDSGVCLKAWCKQNLSSPISATFTLTRGRQRVLPVSRNC